MADAIEGTAANKSEFRDPEILLRWITALLVVCSVAAAVALVLRVLEYELLIRIANRDFASQEELMAEGAASDQRVQLASGARAVLFLATCIPFGMWIYRAAKNTRALGAAGLKYGPGWSVGSYFVPFVNFVVPFAAMREIWRASADPGNWQAAPGTPLLGWWWFLWIGNGISGWIANTLLTGSSGVEVAKIGSLLASAQNLFQIALNVVVILLLRRITANQIWQANTAQVFQ